jgi:hypothetical protein
MRSLKEADNLSIDTHHQAIHHHLTIQFNGLLTKFRQEIDLIICYKQSKKIHLHLQSLKDQLEAACQTYSSSNSSQLEQSIERFRKECSQALNDYKNIKGVYTVLIRNGITRVSIDHLFELFMYQLDSAVRYTQNGVSISPENEHHKTSQLLFSIKNKFILYKN